MRASQRGLSATQQGLRASKGGGADGQTDRQMDGQNFSPFYRTSSPLRATALLLSKTLKQQRSRARELLTI